MNMNPMQICKVAATQVKPTRILRSVQVVRSKKRKKQTHYMIKLAKNYS